MWVFVVMSLCVKGQKFVRLIGVVQLSIVELKHSILNQISYPSLMSEIDANLQNLILKGIYAAFNLLDSMCARLSLKLHLPRGNYFFNGPVPKSNRPCLITLFASNSIKLLNVLRSHFMEYNRSLPRDTQAHRHQNRVHFYLYLLQKVHICLTGLTEKLQSYGLM